MKEDYVKVTHLKRTKYMVALIHGSNIQRKIREDTSRQNQIYLAEINSKYQEWISKINLLKEKTDDDDIEQRVKDLNDYKDFIDHPKFKKEKGNVDGFTSQSKLHSTVMEEFLYHLLSEIPALKDKALKLGPADAYSNLYFSPKNLDSLETDPGLIINTKDQDFAISKEIEINVSLNPKKNIKPQKILVPVVSIECKTYLDKTMYEGSVATAEKIKQGNPYGLFFIVTETYDVKEDVDPKYSQLDQIYILRKSKRDKDEKYSTRNQIYSDVIIDLFRRVEKHLNSVWKNVRIDTGIMIA